MKLGIPNRFIKKQKKFKSLFFFLQNSMQEKMLCAEYGMYTIID